MDRHFPIPHQNAVTRMDDAAHHDVLSILDSVFGKQTKAELTNFAESDTIHDLALLDRIRWRCHHALGRSSPGELSQDRQEVHC